MSKPQYDERGLLEKVSAGDFRAIDGGDLAHVGDVALGTAGYVEKFAPAVGDIIPYSTHIGVALDGVKRYYQNEDERARIAQYFDEKTIRQLVRRNPELNFREDGTNWLDFGAHSASVLGGAGLGGTAATILSIMFFPPIAFTVAPIVGAIAGGTIANKMYDTAFTKHEQDPVIIATQMAEMYAKNGYVTPEIVFAALASASPKKYSKIMDERLNDYTSTKLFTEALSDHENIPKIRAMTVAFDNIVRAQTKMPYDEQNPTKTVAEQYTDMINSGQMRPQDILSPSAGVSAMLAMARKQEQGIDVPNTPDTRQNQISRA